MTNNGNVERYGLLGKASMVLVLVPVSYYVLYRTSFAASQFVKHSYFMALAFSTAHQMKSPTAMQLEVINNNKAYDAPTSTPCQTSLLKEKSNEELSSTSVCSTLSRPRRDSFDSELSLFSVDEISLSGWRDRVKISEHVQVIYEPACQHEEDDHLRWYSRRELQQFQKNAMIQARTFQTQMSHCSWFDSLQNIYDDIKNQPLCPSQVRAMARTNVPRFQDAHLGLEYKVL
eukprot:scaffold37871_cov283-Amphora_coffeaeformis.AAC.1